MIASEAEVNELREVPFCCVALCFPPGRWAEMHVGHSQLGRGRLWGAGPQWGLQVRCLVAPVGELQNPNLAATRPGEIEPDPNLARRIRSESEPGPAKPIRIRTQEKQSEPGACCSRYYERLLRVN